MFPKYQIKKRLEIVKDINLVFNLIPATEKGIIQ